MPKDAAFAADTVIAAPTADAANTSRLENMAFSFTCIGGTSLTTSLGSVSVRISMAIELGRLRRVCADRVQRTAIESVRCLRSLPTWCRLTKLEYAGNATDIVVTIRAILRIVVSQVASQCRKPALKRRVGVSYGFRPKVL